MKRIKHILFWLLYPGIGWMLLLTVCAIPALIYTFLAELETTLFGYCSYVLASYALAILVLGLPQEIKRVRALIYNHPYGSRYMTDLTFRARISLYGSLAVNLLFAAFKLATGILYGSLWFGAVGIYYIILCVARFLLLRHMDARDLLAQYRKSRFCGCLLFALNLALAGMVIQMVHSGKGYEYPGYLIYVFAAYAFYCLVMAIINMVRYHRLGSPVLQTAKVLNLATALVALLSLQTVMFASFGQGDMMLNRIMNSVVGGGVCLAIFAMALLTMIRANRHIHILQVDKAR